MFLYKNRFSLVILLAILQGVSLTGTTFAKKYSSKDLAQVQKDLQAEKLRKAELEKNKKVVQGDIKNIQKKSVVIAKKISDAERKQNELEKSLADLQENKGEIQVKLVQNRSDMLSQVALLQQLSETPFQILMFNKDLNEDSLDTSVQLGAVVKYITILNEDYKNRLVDINNVAAKIELDKQNLNKVQSDILKENQNMKVLLDNKKKVAAQISQDSIDAEKRMAALAVQSKNIEELIKKAMEAKIRAKQLADKKAREKAAAEARKHGKKAPKQSSYSAANSSNNLPTSIASLGLKTRMDWPLNGTVVIKFGQRKDSGIISKGVYIKGRAGSQVLNPHNGTVLFSGDFKSYGQTVIIDHGSEFYTVLAGLSSVYVSEGAKVITGEPIGKMGAGNTNLYMEFRHGSSTVDPAKFFQ